MSAKRLNVAIVGAGGLARALAHALTRSRGVALTVAARRPAAAARAVRGLSGARAAPTIEEAIASAKILILAVPDRAIASVARACAPRRGSWRGVVVLHAAGAYGTELLAPFAARGAAVGVLHPLAVAGADGGAAIDGAFARIEGTAAARAAARKLCSLAGLTPLRGAGLSSSAGRKRYHAAASLASNDVVALLAAALGLMIRDGVPRRDALSALTKLAGGAIAQVGAAGPEGALTGPVARNDAKTLAAQLRALAGADPAAAEAHRALSLRLVELARASGRMGRETSRDLRAVLARGRGGSRTV